MSAEPAVPENIRFPVSGITCGACVPPMVEALRRLDAVTAVHVDLRHETVTVHRQSPTVPLAALGAALAEAGYTADLEAAVVAPPVRGLRERLFGR